MPIRFNLSHQTRQPRGGDGPAVAPGESFDFSDEEAEHLDAEWSDVDPRAGLAEEKAFKAKRDSKASPAPSDIAAEAAEEEQSA